MLGAAPAYAEWKPIEQGNYTRTYLETPYRKIADDIFGVFILVEKNYPVIVSFLYNCKTPSVNWFEVTTYKRNSDNNISLGESSKVNITRQLPINGITSMNPRLMDGDAAFAKGVQEIAPPLSQVCKQ